MTTGRDYTDAGVYFDGIARTALVIRDDLREVDPHELLAELTLACESEPMRMAQVVMALAAMMPPDEGVKTLTDRVWSVSAPRTAA